MLDRRQITCCGFCSRVTPCRNKAGMTLGGRQPVQLTRLLAFWPGQSMNLLMAAGMDDEMLHNRHGDSSSIRRQAG